MWNYEFTKHALEDLKKLDLSQAKQILKKIEKVSDNPIAKHLGGMGIPLCNKHGINLSGYLEVKHKGLGIRAIYELKYEENIMKIIAIDKREDYLIYQLALSRIDKKT